MHVTAPKTGNKPAEFISLLNSAIELMFKCQQEIILIGDYILDMLVNEDEGRTENKALKNWGVGFVYSIKLPNRREQIIDRCYFSQSSRTLRYLRQLASWS